MQPLLLIFSLVITLQLVFVLSLALSILKHSSKADIRSKSVSVIVAARNEHKNLPHLLNALTTQNHSNFEVIIANDRSTDASLQLLTNWSSKYSFIKVIDIKTLPQGWTGKKFALYEAINKASNEVLLFTDADCVPDSENWISSMTSYVNNESEIIIGYSPYRQTKGWLNRFIQFETLFVGLQYLGFAKLKRPYMAVGRNLAILKEAYDLDFLKSIGGLEGGDDDLMLSHLAQKGKQTDIEISPESLVFSSPKSDTNSYLKQKIRHLSAGKHYHQKDQTLLGIFTLSWLVGWGMFISVIFLGINIKFALVVFGIRSLVVYLILNQLGRKLKTDINFWALPFLDFCYCFYYPWVAIKALATKQVEWK